SWLGLVGDHEPHRGAPVGAAVHADQVDAARHAATGTRGERPGERARSGRPRARLAPHLATLEVEHAPAHVGRAGQLECERDAAASMAGESESRWKSPSAALTNRGSAWYVCDPIPVARAIPAAVA